MSRTAQRLSKFFLAIVRNEPVKILAACTVPVAVGGTAAYVNRIIDSLELTLPENKPPASPRITVIVTEDSSSSGAGS